MNILFLNDYSQPIGGAEVYIQTVMTQLQKRGHKTKLIASNLSRQAYWKTILHPSLKDHLKRLWNLSYVKTVQEEIEHFKPDIIHAHGIFNELSPAAIFASSPIPVIMTIHNTQIIDSLSPDTKQQKITTYLYELLRKKIHTICLKHIALYITPSHYMKKQLEQHAITPVTCIHNSIQPQKPTPITNTTNILYIGRLTEGKGVHLLIAALPHILKKLPQTHLTIVGSGEYKDELLVLTKSYHLEKHISFIGEVAHTEIANYYKSSAIVCVPSIYPDNFPTICLEAMSAGRGIVGTNSGGIPELIAEGKTGYICEPTTEALAHSLISVLSNKTLLHTLGKNAVKKFANYSLDAHITTLLETYNKYL